MDQYMTEAFVKLPEEPNISYWLTELSPLTAKPNKQIGELPGLITRWPMTHCHTYGSWNAWSCTNSTTTWSLSWSYCHDQYLHCKLYETVENYPSAQLQASCANLNQKWNIPRGCSFTTAVLHSPETLQLNNQQDWLWIRTQKWGHYNSPGCGYSWVAREVVPEKHEMAVWFHRGSFTCQSVLGQDIEPQPPPCHHWCVSQQCMSVI